MLQHIPRQVSQCSSCKALQGRNRQLKMNWLSTKHKLDACRKELKGKLGKLFASSCFHSIYIYILGCLFCTNAVLTTVLSSLEPINAPKEIPASIPAESDPIESDDDLCSSDVEMPTSDVYEEETPGESTETETEDEENPQHKK